MDQSTFEQRLKEADPKLAEHLLPLVEFDYSKGRCQKGMFRHISTGSRFYADDYVINCDELRHHYVMNYVINYVINRDELPEPLNSWKSSFGTVGLLLRIKDSRLCRDNNAVFALTAAHFVFQELTMFARTPTISKR